jgi:hypothetical protein
MNPILKAGYDGWIVIEAKKEGVDPGEYCKHAMEYLTSQWPTVQWQE